jgi:hypothetical protein
VREALLDFIQREHCTALPQVRAAVRTWDADAAPQERGAPPQHEGRGASSSIQQPEHAGQHAPEDARKSAEEGGLPSRSPAEID